MPLTKVSYSLISGACINAIDYGASVNSLDNSSAIQSALDAAAAIASGSTTQGGSIAGTIVYLPEGKYPTTATITMPKRVVLVGAGKESTQIVYSGTSNAITSTAPANSSTGVYNGMRDVGIVCSNASSIGACYVDFGGTFCELDNCAFFGGKFGVIFEQTEVSTINLCNFANQLSSGCSLWLADGDRTPGASGGFTNKITVSNCFFNNEVAPHIVSSGGYSQVFSANTFNSGATTADPPLYGRRQYYDEIREYNLFFFCWCWRLFRCSCNWKYIFYVSTQFYDCVELGSESFIPDW